MVSMESMESAKFAFQVFQFFMTGGIGIYVYLTNRDKVTNDRISSLENEIKNKFNDHDSRLARQEQTLKQVPTHRDLEKIHEKINQATNCLARLEGESSETRRTVTLIHEHLMENK